MRALWSRRRKVGSLTRVAWILVEHREKVESSQAYPWTYAAVNHPLMASQAGNLVRVNVPLTVSEHHVGGSVSLEQKGCGNEGPCCFVLKKRLVCVQNRLV